VTQTRRPRRAHHAANRPLDPLRDRGVDRLGSPTTATARAGNYTRAALATFTHACDRSGSTPACRASRAAPASGGVRWAAFSAITATS
jgi:hypothetical protein